MIKSELRKIYLDRQKRLSPQERCKASEVIASDFLRRFDPIKSRVVHCFLPIEKFNEIDTLPILEKIWSAYPDVATVVPRVDFETGEMTSVKFDHDTELARNRWDIDEPVHDEFVSTDAIDLVLVPGLCFDLSGHRVGYGKGFYDRFLARCRTDCRKIGVSYFEPVDKIKDVHAKDVRVNAVVYAFREPS